MRGRGSAAAAPNARRAVCCTWNPCAMQRLSGFARIGAKRGSTRPAGVPVYLCARGGAVYADSSTCPARSHRTMEIRGSFAELVLQSLDLGERPDAEPMQL